MPQLIQSYNCCMYNNVLLYLQAWSDSRAARWWQTEPRCVLKTLQRHNLQTTHTHTHTHTQKEQRNNEEDWWRLSAVEWVSLVNATLEMRERRRAHAHKQNTHFTFLEHHIIHICTVYDLFYEGLFLTP